MNHTKERPDQLSTSKTLTEAEFAREVELSKRNSNLTWAGALRRTKKVDELILGPLLSAPAGCQPLAFGRDIFVEEVDELRNDSCKHFEDCLDAADRDLCTRHLYKDACTFICSPECPHRHRRRTPAPTEFTQEILRFLDSDRKNPCRNKRPQRSGRKEVST